MNNLMLLAGDADSSLMSTATTALTDGLKSIATSMGSVITSVVPIALPILGASMVVMFGVRWFKKLASK